MGFFSANLSEDQRNTVGETEIRQLLPDPPRALVLQTGTAGLQRSAWYMSASSGLSWRATLVASWCNVTASNLRRGRDGCFRIPRTSNSIALFER
jgi:hypothetical protein